MDIRPSGNSIEVTNSSFLKWRSPSRPPMPRSGLGLSNDSIRLNANESPYGPIPEVQQRMVAACSRVNRYPDVAATALRNSLGQHLGIPPSQIIVGSGSSEFIHMLTVAFGGEGAEVVVPTPSFPMYSVSVSYTKATLVSVPINADDGTVDLIAMYKAITDRTSLIFLCNPNNPTGGQISLAKVKAFLQRVPDHVAIALDEAYWELTDAFIDGVETSLALCEQFPNLIILRTFSKFYGLAGLRVGYAIVHNEEIATRLGSIRVPTMPNTIGLEAALACVEFHQFYLQRARDVVVERTRVLQIVKSLGYEPFPSQTNFYCMPFPLGIDPFVKMGIQVRGGDTIQMKDYVRISLGTMDENNLALEVLRKHATSVTSWSSGEGGTK